MALGARTVSTTARFATLMATAALVVACSSSASPGPTATPVDTTAATPAPASTGAEPTLDLSSFQADANLEALLPDSLGGIALTKLSIAGTTFLASGSPETKPFTDLLTALGKTPADVSLALGSNDAMTVVAYQIKGVDAGTFMSALIAAFTKDQGTTITDVNISGKAVTKIVPPSGDTNYAYPSGDVMFIVAGSAQTDALVAEAFAKLR